MVHAPVFLTFAAQLVRRLWSRSVAVIVNLSSLASNKKFDRIGIVVFRSTTPCAAVNSRSSSARETVISRLPVGAATAVVSVIWGSWVTLVTIISPGNQFVVAGQTVHRIQPFVHIGSDVVCLILGLNPLGAR